MRDISGYYWIDVRKGERNLYVEGIFSAVYRGGKIDVIFPFEDKDYEINNLNSKRADFLGIGLEEGCVRGINEICDNLDGKVEDILRLCSRRGIYREKGIEEARKIAISICFEVEEALEEEYEESREEEDEI
ncbi:MAG: hypothetical protein ACP5D2_00670 [Candidatus Nanoarchaeia archaeon]